MTNTKYLSNLIVDYGETFYGAETPEYMASRWVEALPEADLTEFREWFDCGFWEPDVARALSDARVHPWEVSASTAYDLCNNDLSTSSFKHGGTDYV